MDKATEPKQLTQTLDSAFDTESDVAKRSSGSSDRVNEVFKSVSREGYPQARDRTQPWKDIYEVDDQWEPASWNIIGKAWKSVTILAGELYQFGTGAT